MPVKKSKFDLLTPQHKKAAHELWLARTRDFPLSEETHNFLEQNPQFVSVEFDIEFERDPFHLQLGNPNYFFCPEVRSSVEFVNPPDTPPYSAPSDVESEQEDNSSDSTIPVKGKSKGQSKKQRSPKRTGSSSTPVSVIDSCLDTEDNLSDQNCVDSDYIDFHEHREGEILINRNTPVGRRFSPEKDEEMDEALRNHDMNDDGAPKGSDGSDSSGSESETEKDLPPQTTSPVRV